jgi:hypothetical protein
VLINLVDNAVKFTPNGGTVIIQGCTVDADTVEISVTDTGRGMNPETKARIFERLYQSPESVDRSGLGLGLFICGEIVRLHGGRISVSSEPGRGATFTFTLPAYSLAKLLGPVVAHQNLWPAPFVLVQLQMKPISYHAEEKWKETMRQYLEIVRRCIRIDKDMVLPPIGTSGGEEPVFILASTDLEKSVIMTERIREHLGRLPEFKTTCALSLTAAPVELSSVTSNQSQEERVRCVADTVTEMIKVSVGPTHSVTPRSSCTSN